MAYLKGENVNIYKLKTGTTYELLAQAAKSCTFSVTANTTDAASKSDSQPMWNNPEFTYSDWSMSQEAFLCTMAELHALMDICINGSCLVDVAFHAGNSGIKQYGKAIISSLSIDAPVGDYVNISISLEGASALTGCPSSYTFQGSSASTKIHGKALMLAYLAETGGTAIIEQADDAYHTLAAATSHKLSFSAQTADVKTKDDNERSIVKEVTGKSMTLSTDNLVNISNGTVRVANMFDGAYNGRKLTFGLAYVPDSIGTSSSAADWEPSDDEDVRIYGDCYITSFSMNAANKENVTYSCELTMCGKPALNSL